MSLDAYMFKSSNREHYMEDDYDGNLWWKNKYNLDSLIRSHATYINSDEYHLNKNNIVSLLNVLFNDYSKRYQAGFKASTSLCQLEEEHEEYPMSADILMLRYYHIGRSYLDDLEESLVDKECVSDTIFDNTVYHTFFTELIKGLIYFLLTLKDNEYIVYLRGE